MKRDWEIIRIILLKLEAAPDANTMLQPSDITEYPEQEIAYNMRLLHQAGYIEATFVGSGPGDGKIYSAIARHMTNSGHELLDSIRNETVWSKTKDTFRSKGLDMTIDLVMQVSKKIMESLLT